MSAARRFVVVALFALLPTLLALPVAAAPAPSLSVVDIQLGKPFAFEQCATKKYTRLVVYDIQPARPCWKHLASGPQPGTPALNSFSGFLELPRDSVPQPLQADSVGFVVVDGMIEGLRFQTSGYRVQEQALELLTAKYGPGEVKRTVSQNRMGASFDDVSAIWSFDDLQVTFFGMLDRVDFGVVGILTPKAQAFEGQQREAKKASQPTL